SEKERESEILPFVHFLVIVAARKDDVVSILRAQHETASQIELEAAADIADSVVAVFRLLERRFRVGIADAGAERQVGRDAPFGDEHVHEPEGGAIAVRELAEDMVDRELDRKVIAEGVAAECGDETRAAEVPRHDAALPAATHVILAGRLLEVERLAGRFERRDHLFARGPALDASIGPDLKPVGAALDDVDLAAAFDDMEDGIPPPRPGMQLDERVRNQDLARFVVGLRTRCKK